MNRIAFSLPRKIALLVALGAFPAAPALAQTATADAPRYRTYDELTASLRALSQTNSSLVKLVDLGKSHEGRSVWAVEIASGSKIDARPALLVAANFEGDQLIGSELALFLARHLASSYGSDTAVKKLLDEHAVYIIARANPDGAEAMFGKVKSFRRTNARKFDEDNDGRVDEDGPDDLNGDGFISVMRVKDPKGPYMVHPDDARLLRRADAAKGEAGGWSVHWEGIDNDGDGFINEDGPGGVDLNRNFQHRYPYYTSDAGPHMVSEPETRAVMDYILKKKNIAMILTYGASDNLIAAPTSAGALAPAQAVDLLAFADQSLADARKLGTFTGLEGGGQFFFGGGGGGGGGFGQGGSPAAPQTRPPGQPAPRPPATTIAAPDVEYFKTVSEKYRTLTGVRNAPATRAPAGAFFEYGYYQFGVPSFSTPGWGLAAGAAPPAPGSAPPSGALPPGSRPGGGPGAGRGGGPGGAGGATPAGAEEPGGTAVFDARIAKALANGFITWTPFAHPTLGAVEIGGFKPSGVTNPESSEIEALGKSHAAFAVYLGSLFPKVAIADFTSTSLGGGLYRLKAEVENVGYLPTSTAHGVTSQSVKPTMVQLGIPPESLVSGDAKTSFISALAGSGRRQSYQWIVRGKTGQVIAVKAAAEKGGSAESTVTLK